MTNGLRPFSLESNNSLCLYTIFILSCVSSQDLLLRPNYNVCSLFLSKFAPLKLLIPLVMLVPQGTINTDYKSGSEIPLINDEFPIILVTICPVFPIFHQGISRFPEVPWSRNPDYQLNRDHRAIIMGPHDGIFHLLHIFLNITKFLLLMKLKRCIKTNH